MLLAPTLLVRALTFWKIPLIFAVRPRILQLDDEGCAIQIKLRRFTKNHLGVMYFGALCIGADAAGGLNAGRLSLGRYKGVEIIFKDFTANFLKRSDGDVVIRCTQGRQIEQAMKEAYETRERVTLPVELTATVPARHGDEPVARFVLGLSMKRRG